ncbi:arginine--tRNA ligase [Candidatus Curtissbacteria bacterium RIFCSPLOWO2_01_FULL_42_26]|uniref:Arginine--tRNA ligase n=1 Tax=Candidatus Curtissbacteria bacterium RIFCSPLOWO2_01_FULL_42_26 TaxID=1797729 RepID=A0A1F5HY55_9BACT|nr:MAG: arginine--tRNA ligase [Candidatus Curtissbacteria bacterium RIFCSPLOWO2_01_FULL_42_26]
MNLREQIRKDIEDKVSGMVGQWDGRVEVTRASDARFGDYTSNVALRYAQGKLQKEKAIKQSPMEFAKKLADSFKNQAYIEKLEVKEPGFLNFFIKDEVLQNEVEKVLKAKDKFGSNESGKGKKARVEFVSANPTGPLHFGNARGGPIGDCLSSVLEFCGYTVLREYLHNDVGGQVEKLGESIVNVSKGQGAAEQEYQGEYVAELAAKIGKVKSAKEAGKAAVKILLDEVIVDCGAMGIVFDKVYQESDFVKSGQTAQAIQLLEKKKALKKQEGAIWFAPNDAFLKDRETVVVKSNGDYTYFANDIAYHRLKFTEGYDLVIDVFGANHHGHVPRLQAVVSAFGFDTSNFKVVLYQWVRFKRGPEVIKMSKRAGTFVTAREVLDEVGRDAARFFILMHDGNSHIDFDLDLAREKSAKNPVYYVQYAHARISSILVKAKIEKYQISNIKYQILDNPYELTLIRNITRLPELVEDISASFAVNQLTNYARELADSFHKFYENCRVLGEDKKLEDARIALILATKIALANTLKLLGVSAPEKM